MSSMNRISPIEKYLASQNQDEIVALWLNQETDVMLLMAKDIVGKIGNNTFVKNAIQQDKITNSDTCGFRHKGFLLESERANWYERNHSSIVGYAKLFMKSRNQTIESWAEWSKWNLPTTTQEDRNSAVHKLSLSELAGIFLSGDFNHEYHTPIASAFAITMLSIMTDRFLDAVEYSMKATNTIKNPATNTQQ